MEKSITEKEDKLYNIYLLYGEEEYLKDLYMSRLKKQIVGDMNDAMYRFTEPPLVNEINDIIYGFSMFCDKKLIIISGSGWFKAGGSMSLSFIDDLAANNTYMIFREDNIDKRSKLYKAISEKGVVSPCERQNENSIYKLLCVIVNREGKKLPRDSFDVLLGGIGYDICTLLSEIEKLIIYTEERLLITPEDVKSVCKLSVNASIFELCDSVGNRNREKAYIQLARLLECGEKPPMIAYMIRRHFSDLYDVKSCETKGLKYNDIRTKLNMKDFVLKKYMTQISNFTVDEIKDKLALCLEIDEALKTGGIRDKMALEVLIS